MVVDCGNGAAFRAAPTALRALGATVDVIHASPDGVNINAGCGSTHPGDLQEAVLLARADAGLAFDGDADRVIAVDERGVLVDGDEILAITAIDLHDRKLLRGDAVVATVMSNLGLRRALEPYGVAVIETPVGDRNVLDVLEQRNLSLGGEQSGHVIFADHATTGDGTLTGIVLLDTMARRGRSLSELAAVLTRVPQVLRNVTVGGADQLRGDTAFWSRVARRRRRAGRRRPGARAALGHRAAGAGDGGVDRRRRRRRGRRPAGRAGRARGVTGCACTVLARPAAPRTSNLSHHVWHRRGRASPRHPPGAGRRRAGAPARRGPRRGW